MAKHPENKSTSQPGSNLMPDIAKEVRPELTGRLDRVGMTEIEVPIQIKSADGTIFRTPAKAEAFVSLDEELAKGIHMSRLFLSLQEGLTQNPIDFGLLKALSEAFIDSHEGLSHSSLIRVSFDYPLLRPALKSSFKGWRNYPISLMVRNQNGHIHFEIETKILYSSTCPCSAALARKLIQDNFKENFGSGPVEADEIFKWLGKSEGINATPHSQRSEAIVRVRSNAADDAFILEDLINQIEGSLGTPVQAAVKREDEMEFARLNAANLMFCEDAARKIKHRLEQDARVSDYYVKVSHIESLHPHNAVSIAVKGVADGYRPEH